MPEQLPVRALQPQRPADGRPRGGIVVARHVIGLDADVSLQVVTSGADDVEAHLHDGVVEAAVDETLAAGAAMVIVPFGLGINA